MKLIEPSYTILTDIDKDSYYNLCEDAARTCYQSFDKKQEGTAEKMIRMLIRNNHLAMIEHVPTISVKFICDRAFSHELVRMRLCSFAQESQRYVKYENNDMEFITPHWYNLTNNNIVKNEFVRALVIAESAYKNLRQFDLQAQDARAVLPNATKTEIICTTNIREWRHIFKLRTDKAAHPEMRRLMCPLLDELKEKLPAFFDDITY